MVIVLEQREKEKNLYFKKSVVKSFTKYISDKSSISRFCKELSGDWLWVVLQISSCVETAGNFVATSHAIVWVRPTKRPEGRTSADCESVNKCLEGVCKIYEEHLKQPLYPI